MFRWPILLLPLLLFGCLTAGVHVMSGLLPVPKPQIDEPFHSVEYYNNKYHLGLQQIPHFIEKEKKKEIQDAEICSKIGEHIKINGSSTNCKPNLRILNKAKKIGINDYVIACSTVPVGERQKGDGYCWAACSQFLIAAAYRVHIPQEKIVVAIKGSSPKEMMDQAGSISETMKALGFGGVTFMPNGSEIILASLADNQPVMIGIIDPVTQFGHAVVIVAARFSFPDAAGHFCPGCGKFAFSELDIYDPLTGETTTWPATKIEDKLDFIMTYAEVMD